MVNDHFVLWPWRPRELQFNSPHILSFTDESIIKLAWIQFQHLHLGAVLVPWSSFFSEFLCLLSHSLAVSRFRKPCLLSWSRHHPTISSSVIPFSSCPQSFPAFGFFQISQLFAWGGQSIGVSASTSVLPMSTEDWSPLGWTGWISLQSKGLSRVFSNTTVQKHQFFCIQLSL